MKKTLVCVFGFIICLMVTVVAFAAPVPDTGQSKCYNATVEIPCPSPGQPFYGQDANYTINPMSFTKLDGNGNVLPDSATSWVMVRDNVTGLIWENKTVDGTIHDKGKSYTWYDPTDPYPGTPGDGTDTKDFLDALNSAKFGGYSDWRLPTIKELVSIVNYGIPAPGLPIYTGYFSNTAVSQYWSSTTNVGSTNNAWGVYFGSSSGGSVTSNNKLYVGSVRAVLGGQAGSLDHSVIGSFDTVNSVPSDDALAATGNYTDNGDGTVTDTSTGLRWQQAGSSNTQTWEQALAYCEGLSLGGHTDWRLPSSKELQSLVDYSRYYPTINTTYFPSTAASWYWSSTTHVNLTLCAWDVGFGPGGGSYSHKSLAGNVRAVRGGQSVSLAAPVPDTGQTKCYDATVEITCPSSGQPFYGQDAQYAINPMSYTKLDGSGNVLSSSATYWVMVKDNVTGLIWEMKTQQDGVKNYSDPHDADNTYTWYDSNPATNGGYAGTPGTGTDTEDFIKSLNDAHYTGHSDWRLPTAKELAYIVNYGISYPGPTINTGYFSNTAASWYWSSTTDVHETRYAWGVHFGSGYRGGNYDYKSGSYYVRAVRGVQSGVLGDLLIGSFDAADSVPISDATASTGGYTDNDDGTVTDTSTDLTWQQAGSSNTQTWEQALAYCEGLSLGGHTDWRLPTIKELQSLADHSRYNPAINPTYFPNSAASRYWSSTTSASYTNGAWGVDFSLGYDYSYGNKDSSYDVRAVRGGQPGSMGHLVISPTSRSVSKDAGTTTFSVSNTGTGTMPWTAAVTSGSSWLSITSGTSGTDTGTITCSFTSNTTTSARTETIRVTAPGATGTPVDVTVTQVPTPTPTANPIIGSNSIDSMDVVKITDMSGLLPDSGRPVTVRAWDKDGKQLTAAGYASPLSIINHGTTSILGADLKDRFPDGAPAAYTFSVESSQMFITNINNSSDGAVRVPIIYSNGLSNFTSNSIGSRNTLKVTDMSGTIASGGIAITVAAWDVSGNAIPESTSAETLKLYSHGTTTIAGSSLPARFPSGMPMTYEFTIASPKLIVSNVKNSSDGTLNIPTVYTVGVSNFVSNSIGSRNTLYISEFSGTLGTGGAVIVIKAWDASGKEIPESGSVTSYNIFNYETIKITGAELASRFSSGTPMTYEFTVNSSRVVITNVKSSSGGGINIPTVYISSGITNYTTNYVSDLNTTIQITDMSGSIPTGGASITIIARDVDGKTILESGSAIALKLNNYGTTTIEGDDLQNRFPDGVPVTYEFSIGSSIAVVTNLTKSSDGMINIPTVFTIGPYGGI